ncbi:regulator of microtubule dynamics protein 2 isoform X3 [Acipenser ruthenus]|uniref:regulator of microtubule dynamics protein 2 isoform X3 n=1 Tax=Acipenser ruthenus TaxID=7906 RepID=UPI0027409054|nr:regulator of microtubule dynamics protein 2 isoform X3 [Acipenser ruthenus]
MSQPDSRALVLSVLIGAAGISLALVWYKSRKSRVYTTLTDYYLSNNERHLQFNADDRSGGAVLLFQGKQTEMLEKLNTLILCVSELKDEVKSLKEGIPKLQEQVREELRGKLESRRMSPLHRATRRKRTEIPREDCLSSEEAESEGGYVTAHTDTEEESDEGNKDPTVNFPTTEDLIEEKDEFTLLMQKADSLHTGPESEKKEGFMMLLEKKDQYGQEVPFLWRLARSYGDMFDLTSDIEDKKSYTEAGKIFAEKAITLDPMSADSHQWFAIMCGYMSEYESVQNKIKNGYLFKDHLDKAIELKPQDPLSYYLLGRWCYAVSQLSWIERKVAATLFGNPPTATIQDALHYFHKDENPLFRTSHGHLPNPLLKSRRNSSLLFQIQLCLLSKVLQRSRTKSPCTKVV